LTPFRQGAEFQQVRDNHLQLFLYKILYSDSESGAGSAPKESLHRQQTVKNGGYGRQDLTPAIYYLYEHY